MQDYVVDLEAKTAKEKRIRDKAHKLLLQYWRDTFKNDANLAVLDDLFIMFGIYRTPFAVDTNDTMRLIGQKEAGLRILERIQEADPNIYLKLIQKRMKEDKS